MRGLTGKVAVVTGASRGIGAAVARRLAQEGARVAVNSFEDRDAMQTVVDSITEAGGKAQGIDADVSDAMAVERLFNTVLQTWQGVDLLVSNAGICPFEDWWHVTEDLWQKVQDINMKGTFLCAHRASEIMRDQGRGGRIIATSSISALVGGGLQTHYTPTKAGIRSLMQSLAIVLGPYQITCNSLLPGTILTDINKGYYTEHPEFLPRDAGRVPLGRLGTPEDVAGAAAFLASEDARYITGADLLIDGGLFVNLQ